MQQGRLRVNADWVILEPVDADHRPLPNSQVSHTTLLTNLANPAQPLIRFDIGDRILIESEACAGRRSPTRRSGAMTSSSTPSNDRQSPQPPPVQGFILEHGIDFSLDVLFNSYYIIKNL